MAWHVRSGVWNGTSLNGLSAVASVVSEANLQDEQATRKAVLYIDANATSAQADALDGGAENPVCAVSWEPLWK